jgi:hypothetical protein
MQKILTTITLSLLAGLAMGTPARADDKPPPTFSISGYVDGGITGNLTGATAGTNFGRLFDDRANQLMLNQASILFTKPLDPNATGLDFGFTFQPMYGSDARYTHLIGLFDRSSDERNQFTFLEADVLMHLPIFGGGSDVKLGIFPSSLSAETTVPTTNPFYSHSYIFNFGVTVAHTGIFTDTHLTPLVDLYLGVDSGNQTTLFRKGDNNDSAAGWAGLGLNLMDGNLTVLWLNHFGPENPRGTLNQQGQLVDDSFRSESTITTIWKYSDSLTLTTDLNFAHDDGFSANAYGIAQYASYTINDMLTFQARGELWRDDKGFFVAAFPGSLDSLNALAGRPNGSLSLFPQPATYGEITLGLNIKPTVPGPLSSVMFRPEIRYDTTLNNARPFDNGRRKNQFTIAADAIVAF